MTPGSLKLGTTNMRLKALLAAALITWALPAQAAWTEYVYPELGIAKYFPAEPKMSKGTWGEGIRLPLSKIVPDTILSIEDGGVTYKLTVVDFGARPAEGANIMAEAFSSLAAKGKVVTEGFPRLDLGANSVYGLTLIVDEKSGIHATSAVFFNKGKLYLVQALVPQNSPARFDSGIGRFVETIRFHLEGYGFDEKLGRDFPLGDCDPNDRDLGNNRPAPRN
jgi:hypothetical protein